MIVIKKRFLSLLVLLLSLIVGEVQAQKSLPSKHGFEQNGMSANAREVFGQNRNSANAREVQSATTAQTPSRRSVLRAPSTDAQAPTGVAARGITGASATVSWNGTGDSYNLRYRKMYLSEGFESCLQGQVPDGWTALDADGDGHSWFAWDYYKDTPNDQYGNPCSFDRMSVESASYDNGALTPDNWLISPQVPLKGKLSLWAKGVDPDYAAEHFAIYLSTTGKDVADFTVLIPETEAQGVFTEYTADLSAYAGQVGYIAIRHFHVSDEYKLGVDNITITDDWVEADGVTSPYTLDGLDGPSIYEVEVQAVTGEQQSSWSTLRFKTVPTNATILYQQNFDDTNDINELGWTFVDNDGDGRNWTMSINGKYDYDTAEYSPSYTSTSVPNSLFSQSYTLIGRSAINADNWAITPAIKIDESSILSFQLAYADPDAHDKVGVYVGETANVNEMTEVLAPKIFSRTHELQFNEETVDLSAFAGKTCYIAFRHQDNDKYVVFIDDVTVYTIPPTYDLTLADGTEDATSWQGKAGEGKYQELPLEGVFAGTAVSVKYNGTKHVKSVKAVKKAAAAPAGTDLSMVDCAGNARASQWTANCYMVHMAGDYYLPLVYGNAIKSGADNTAAYTGVSGNDNATATFPRHDGQAITAPWIKDNGITVASAELLWQDAQGMITAVGISGDYLTLTVGKDATELEGNALVAAKDTDGTIVWSWHIWVTKQTFTDLTEIAAEVTSTAPNTSYTYQLTPVNLGWVGDATSTTGYHTYYQWGRKDAFIPGTGTGNTNRTVYDINDATVTAISYTADNSMTIGGNIQHPTVHNLNSTTGSPYDTQYYNMWDAQQTSNTKAAAATVKTVYDPCPPGFCVPTSGLYDYIKSQTRPTFNNGYTYSGVFFPASGYRGSNSGDLSNVGTGGYCWSATPSDGARGRNFGFGSGSWNLSNSSRAMGCPVRAVAE